MFAIFK